MCFPGERGGLVCCKSVMIPGFGVQQVCQLRPRRFNYEQLEVTPVVFVQTRYVSARSLIRADTPSYGFN